MIAIVVGLSRAVVGVHWPLDIFTGAFGGWMTGIVGSMLASAIRLDARHVQIILCTILAACAVIYGP